MMNRYGQFLDMAVVDDKVRTVKYELHSNGVRYFPIFGKVQVYFLIILLLLIIFPLII